jgi:hypothetical protein
MFFGSSILYGQQIIWNYDNGAQATGEGCSLQDTAFISAGDEISVIFSHLGIDLSGSGALTGNTRCRIMIPVQVTRGFYMGELTENLIYGYIQQGNSEAKILSRGQFLGYNSMIARTVNRGNSERNAPYLEARHRQNINFGRFCNGQTTRTRFTGTISINAKRNSQADDIVVQIDGLDIRYQLKGSVKACPGRGHHRS